MNSQIWQTLQGLLADPAISKTMAVVIGVITIHGVVRFVHTTLLNRVEGMDTRYRLRKLISAIGAFATILLVTLVFSSKLGSLTVAFGVAGAGIAFALQEVIASIAGWVAVSLGNFYSVGDRVQLGGITGDIIDIGVLRTTLMETGQWVKGDLYNGRIVKIANSFVFKEPVFNYSGDFPFLWDEIVVPIKYGSDHRLAREIMQQVAVEELGGLVPEAKETWQLMVNKFRIEDARIEPTVTMIATDNWLEFTVRYVTNYKQRRSSKDILFTRILDAFEATNGRVSLASTTVHLVDAPVLKVQVSDNRG